MLFMGGEVELVTADMHGGIKHHSTQENPT